MTSPEKSPEPSHIMHGKYVALMETNDKEGESWYYLIRLENNEEALQLLQKQLEEVDWYLIDDLSTFDLDLEHQISATTAKEMTKLELNAHSFHRKFDGKLKDIHFGFKKKDSNDRKIEKAFDLLGYGQIEDYIDDEDLDPEDLRNSDDESSSDEESSEEESSEEESCDNKSCEEDSDDESSSRKGKGVPPALLNSTRPRWTRGKRGFRKR